MDHNPEALVGKKVMIRTITQAAKRGADHAMNPIQPAVFALHHWVKIIGCNNTHFTALHENGKQTEHTWDEAKAWGK